MSNKTRYAVIRAGHGGKRGIGGQCMRKAMVDGKLMVAGPDSPEVAVCPCCGGVVTKRKRRRLDGQTTYFYRHKRGVG
jgi:hypothetical protein